MLESHTVDLHLFGPCEHQTPALSYPVAVERGAKPLLSGVINYIHFIVPERSILSVLWIVLIKRLNNTDEYAQKGRFISRLCSLQYL